MRASLTANRSEWRAAPQYHWITSGSFRFAASRALRHSTLMPSNTQPQSTINRAFGHAQFALTNSPLELRWRAAKSDNSRRVQLNINKCKSMTCGTERSRSLTIGCLRAVHTRRTNGFFGSRFRWFDDEMWFASQNASRSKWLTLDINRRSPQSQSHSSALTWRQLRRHVIPITTYRAWLLPLTELFTNCCLTFDSRAFTISDWQSVNDSHSLRRSSALCCWCCCCFWRTKQSFVIRHFRFSNIEISTTWLHRIRIKSNWNDDGYQQVGA